MEQIIWGELQKYT